MNWPLHRFFQFLDLNVHERALIANLGQLPRTCIRGEILRRQGAEVDHIYLLREGWVTSSVGLPDGSEKIVKVHLPGDILGAPSMALQTAGETLKALTPAIVQTVHVSALGRIFSEAPRLAAAFFLCAQQERVFLMDHAASIGMTSALQRTAAFLLSVFERLRAINPEQGNTFALPLRQADLADLLGLSAVHMNRTLQTLEREGYIARGRKGLTLNDISALHALANRPEREWTRAPAWVSALPHAKGAPAVQPAQIDRTMREAR